MPLRHNPGDSFASYHVSVTFGDKSPRIVAVATIPRDWANKRLSVVAMSRTLDRGAGFA